MPSGTNLGGGKDFAALLADLVVLPRSLRAWTRCWRRPRPAPQRARRRGNGTKYLSRRSCGRARPWWSARTTSWCR